jgi:hypothetical protein
MGDEDASFMQTTVREHAASSSAAVACSSCHSPHGLGKIRDPEWLRGQLSVRAERRDGVKITLAQRAAGHAFPTGDLFRRLEVGAELRAPDGTVRARDVRHLARHFVVAPDMHGRTLVRDDRLREEPVTLDLDVKGTGAVHFWVRYQRVAQAGSGLSPERATIESEVLLHSGVLE